MLVALDLTERQAHRVLAQARQQRARMEIEPRPEHWTALLWGTVVDGDEHQMRVDVQGLGPDTDITPLLGATCDVRVMLSDQLYMFSTFIVDVRRDAAPHWLSLANPQIIQVANRRRVLRKAPTEPIPVRIVPPDSQQGQLGDLANIGAGGIGCRMNRKDVGELLLIGDKVQVEFVLPWTGELFTLPATVCTKSSGSDPEQLAVGFEFVTAPGGASTSDLDRLRRALNSETSRLTEMNGDL